MKSERRLPVWSITARLTVLYTAFAFAMLLASTLFLQWVLASNLDREDDQYLTGKVNEIRTILRNIPTDPGALRDEIVWEVAAPKSARYYARVCDAGGHTLIETPGMDTALRTVFPRPLPGRKVVFATTSDRSGHVYRLASGWATLGTDGAPRLLEVALDATGDDALVDDYQRKMIAVLVAGILLLAAAGRAAARRGLRPLEEITTSIERVTATHLHERIGSEPWPAELRSLAAEFDVMLARLENAFTQLSQFSADLAHELRTPISNLRGEAEVALARPRTADEYRRVLESSLEEYERLTQMIEQLLFLARAESARESISQTWVDGRRLLESVRDFHEAVADEGGITVEVHGEGDVYADATLLGRAVSNLLSNALRHTPAGGRIDLTLVCEIGRAVIRVADSGEGIAREHLSKIFDRFYRVDPARKHPGSGLGLAIVKSIAELHGGSVTLDSEPGRGTVVDFALPQSREDPHT